MQTHSRTRTNSCQAHTRDCPLPRKHQSTSLPWGESCTVHLCVCLCVCVGSHRVRAVNTRTLRLSCKIFILVCGSVFEDIFLLLFVMFEQNVCTNFSASFILLCMGLHNTDILQLSVFSVCGHINAYEHIHIHLLCTWVCVFVMPQGSYQQGSNWASVCSPVEASRLTGLTGPTLS